MNIVKRTKKEIAEREKRKVSIHEAAHAFVCFMYGGYGIPEVWKNTAQNVMNGEKAWLGTFKMYGAPGTQAADDSTRKAMGVLPTPDNWRVLVGLAGVVAEHISDGITDAEEIGCYIDDAICADEISQTDLDLMGNGWGVADVALVLKVLSDRWADVEREADALIAGTL